MEEETYNAKEARAKLNLPSTTFYRKVKEGEIPYRGQRPHMRFPKAAIDAIAEIELTKNIDDILIFKQSTVADIWKQQEFMQDVYSEIDETSFKTLLMWRKRNEEILMQVNEGTEILGWTMFLPLDEEVIFKLIGGKMRERDIPSQAIKKWDDEQVSVYISMLEVIPSLSMERDRVVAAFLIRKAIKWAYNLRAQCDIKNWYGAGTSPEGQAILEALGFKQINSMEEGKIKYYKLDDISKASKLLKTLWRKR